MTLTLSPRIHAGAALAVALLAAALLHVSIVAPALSARREIRDRAAELEAQQSRFAAAAASVPALRREIESLRAGADDAVGFLRGESPALIAADVQRRLNGLVGDHGGTLVSTQVAPVRANEAFPIMTVKAHVRADIAAMAAIFDGITQSEPVLLLDNVVIQAAGGGTARRGSAQAALLDVRFDLIGYLYEQR